MTARNSIEYEPSMESVSKTIKVIKNATKSPHCETELHIESAVAFLESKYCDVVYSYIWIYIEAYGPGQARQDSCSAIENKIDCFAGYVFFEQDEQDNQVYYEPCHHPK